MMDAKSVLILCTGNSCRSQMAEGFIRHYWGDQLTVYSAGLSPSRVHPKAIQVMAEKNVDISGQKSESVDIYLDKDIDLVISVCGHADQHCPAFPTKTARQHIPFDDPAHATGTEAEILDEFRRVRDEIEQQFRRFNLVSR